MKQTLNVKAVFFDFDDTLQSRKGAYRLYCEAFLTRYFPNIGEKERLQKLDEMEALVDGGYKDREVYFPELIALWGWENHPPLQELYDSFNLDFGKYIVLLPGAVETLKELKRRGYLLGAVTNGVSSLQNIKLDTAGIRALFDVVVVSGDIGVYKPDRRIFDEAARRLGVENRQVLFVGDHPVNDIDGALGAGMYAIRMNYGDFKGKGLGKATVAEIEHIDEVLDYLE
ncbi:MAG: HAD family hydrolase [Clostridia bacterium]|nr:HAD family hydrolase [Clostridia bacterium]